MLKEYILQNWALLLLMTAFVILLSFRSGQAKQQAGDRDYSHLFFERCLCVGTDPAVRAGKGLLRCFLHRDRCGIVCVYGALSGHRRKMNFFVWHTQAKERLMRPDLRLPGLRLAAVL